ncbi:MAG TPA: VWA domain-containing protein [Terriglobales bacterium]|nr:VWA domain-containing protein [Terriglobales bacterium]
MHLRNDRALLRLIFAIFLITLWTWSALAQSGTGTPQQNPSTVPPQPPLSSVPPPTPVPSSGGTSQQPNNTPQPTPAPNSSAGAATQSNPPVSSPVGSATSSASGSAQGAQQSAPPSVGIGSGSEPTQPPAPVTPPPTVVKSAPANPSQPASGSGAAPGAAGHPANGAAAGQPASSAGGQSQAPSGQEGGTFVFKKQVEEVILHATVLDEKQRLVTNLGKTAFTVFENNQPQVITSFRHEDIPVAMGIVIDNSGSMREKRDKVNKAAVNLVRSSNPQDEVFVVNFNDEYYLDQDFTGAIPKLREALEKVDSRGGTALYDAVVASADHLKKNAKLEKKVLFVVTDGEDNASRESLETAIRRLQAENGPTVYAIGLLGEEKQRRARRALQEMATRTGGVAFFPKDLSEVDEISSTVAHDIRNQYTIGYKPTTPKSVGGYRAIHVDARAKGYGKLTVRTRSGYFPGQEKGPEAQQ